MRGKHLNSGIRGGLWDEQHFQGMGPAVWLFGWLIHRQTRERDGVGLVLAGSPLTYQIISQDTGIARRTLKRWMAKLARAGYVQVTHVAHKRMVIRIIKAKKFGPQQLSFPQKQFSFPQAPFFAPKSKGPLSAPEVGSKGPVMAQKNTEQTTVNNVNTEACGLVRGGHRDIKPERKQTITTPVANPLSVTGEALSSGPLASKTKATPQTSQIGSPSPYFPLAHPCPARYGPDRKTLREMEMRAELRVGAGPVVRRE